MREHEIAEETILDRHARSWQAQGYEVVRHPSRADLPAFLSSYMPDAVLLGRSPKVVVEVVRKGQPQVEKKIQALNALLAGQEDWRLEILYAGGEPEILPAASFEQLMETLASVRNLAQVDQRASLLLFWAILEAISRRLEPEKTKRPQSPGRVVELLAGAGFVAPTEAALLREAARWRNRLIHGDLDTMPSREQVLTLADLLACLLDSIERRGSIPPPT
jgi:hypothetical protein